MLLFGALTPQPCEQRDKNKGTPERWRYNREVMAHVFDCKA
jgi:hypothetical protein